MHSDHTLKDILGKFEIHRDPSEYSIMQFGSGLIHKTYLVEYQGNPEYILQKINHHVFQKPFDIVTNISLLQTYLKEHHPEYPFAQLIFAKNDSGLYVSGEDHYRLTGFINGTHSLDICSYPEQAYQAAYAFGKFTFNLNGIDIQQFKYPIPDFHNLLNRFKIFEIALKEGNSIRRDENKDIIEWIYKRRDIVLKYESIINDKSFIKRIIHHDTKISNVLFDEKEKGITVIDLDTTMPGYCISDIGDMIRTYTSPASEEEKDLSMVFVRKEFLQAIIEGYQENMNEQLSNSEKNNLLFGGSFMIFMQALRFFSDYINNDIYYGSKYEGHNLIRTKNQMKLLESFENFI